MKNFAGNLRSMFLKYTRQAYARLPALDRPRILDAGCGEGGPALELARMSGGEVVGIDTDVAALRLFRKRIEEEGLAGRVSAVQASLYDTGFPRGSFDLVWGEGVFHLLEAMKCFAECRRLLKTGGFLVIHDPLKWFDGVRDDLEASCFEIADTMLMPANCWWTDYYEPIEARIRRLGPDERAGIASDELAKYEREIAQVKPDPGRFDCAFFIARAVRVPDESAMSTD